LIPGAEQMHCWIVFCLLLALSPTTSERAGIEQPAQGEQKDITYASETAYTL
jgi:hypothetical protein